MIDWSDFETTLNDLHHEVEQLREEFMTLWEDYLEARQWQIDHEEDADTENIDDAWDGLGHAVKAAFENIQQGREWLQEEIIGAQRGL